MGVFDKVKFWKKGDDFSDLSNLGDFGLEEKPGAPSGLGDMGGLGGNLGGDLGSGLPPIGGNEFHETTGMPIHREEIQPTQASKELGEQFGLKPAVPQQTQQAQPQAMQYPPQTPYPQQQYPTQQQQQQFQPQQAYPAYPQAPNIGEMAKDIEIIHAKLDAIKSTLDAINQRLATIERMAGGEPRQKYGW